MKKVLSLLSLLALTLFWLPTQGKAQVIVSQSQTFTATQVATNMPALSEASLVASHTIFWTTTGTVVGTVTMQGSTTFGGTYTTLGSSTAQNLAASGSYTFEPTTTAFFNMSVVISTCTACTVTLYYQGSVNPPVGATTDNYFFVPETACGGAVTGTAGTGNATDIVALSGGARVFRLSNTNAGASTNTFTCLLAPPGRLSTGKGITITDITFLVSTQTTQPTSITTPTLKSFTAPAAVDPETANSATFVTFGGTITIVPTSAQFAAYTAVSAGQFFSIKVVLGTPVIMNTDLQTLVLVIPFAQSAAAAGVQETPGFYVHYTNNAL